MSDEERALRAQIDAAASTNNSIDVEGHVALSKLLLRAKRAGEAAAHLWPAVQRAPVETSAPLRFQVRARGMRAIA